MLARELRLRLAREHLGRADDGSEDADLLDADSFVAALQASADALQAWYDGGKAGPRPPGRLRPHRPEQVGLLTRLWATPAYRLMVDPDGRPLGLRLRKSF